MHANDAKTDRFDALLALGLAVLILVAFGGALRNGFVNFDDDAYVTENPHVSTGLSIANLRWALTATHSANWHPLTWLSHQLDCELFGLRPAGHHATSLLLHAANAVLLFLFLRRATGARWPSLIVAALFAVHPLRVESVAWAAERKDVLSAFFGLAALCGYVNYARKPGYWGHVLVSVLFTCSLLAKPMLVTFPCVLLLLDYWPLRRIHTTSGPRAFWGSMLSATLEKLPLFALSGAVAALTVLAQHSAGAVAGLETYPWSVRAGNALLSYTGYLGKFFWPRSLAVPYPLHPDAVTPTRIALASALLCLITVAALWQWRRRPVLAVGWFWCLGMLVPVIGFLQVGSQAMADRYTYLPQIGIVWAVVWVAAIRSRGRQETDYDYDYDYKHDYEHETEKSMWHSRPRLCSSESETFVSAQSKAQPGAAVPHHQWLLGVVALVLICTCVALTQRQVAIWLDSETLFRHALAVTRDNSVAHNNLGRHLLEKYLDQRRTWEAVPTAANAPGEPMLQEAVSHFDAALRISPDNYQARNNFGVAMLLGDHIGAAIKTFARVIDTSAADAAFYVNYAAALKRAGKRDDAESMLRRALELEPGFPKALALLEQMNPPPRSP